MSCGQRRRYFDWHDHRGGVSLIIPIVVLSVMVIAIGVVSFASKDLRISKQSVDKQMSRELAAAGLQRALSLAEVVPLWAVDGGSPLAETIDLGDNQTGSFSARVQSTGEVTADGFPILEAVARGDAGGGEVSLTQRFYLQPPKFLLATLSLYGNYDRSGTLDVQGNAYINGRFNSNGDVYISGDFVAKNITINPRAQLGGNVVALQKVELRNRTPIGGDLLAGEVLLPAGAEIEGDLIVAGPAELSSRSVIKGDVRATRIKLPAGADVYGDLVVSGKAEINNYSLIKGNLVADEVVLPAGSEIHGDLIARKITISSSTIIVGDLRAGELWVQGTRVTKRSQLPRAVTLHGNLTIGSVNISGYQAHPKVGAHTRIYDEIYNSGSIPPAEWYAGAAQRLWSLYGKSVPNTPSWSQIMAAAADTAAHPYGVLYVIDGNYEIPRQNYQFKGHATVVVTGTLNIRSREILYNNCRQGSPCNKHLTLISLGDISVTDWNPYDIDALLYTYDPRDVGPPVGDFSLNSHYTGGDSVAAWSFGGWPNVTLRHKWGQQVINSPAPAIPGMRVVILPGA